MFSKHPQAALDLCDGISLMKHPFRTALYGTMTVDNLRQLFEPVTGNLRNIHWLLVIWEGLSCDDILAGLQPAMTADPHMLLRVGAGFAVIYKPSCVSLRLFGNAAVHRAKLPSGMGQLVVKKALLTILQMTETASGKFTMSLKQCKDDGTFSFEQVQDILRGTTRAQLNAMMANAKIATKEKMANKLQRSLLIVHAEIKTWVDDYEKALEMSCPTVAAVSPSQEFPYDFPADVTKKVGWHWDATTKDFVDITLTDYVNTTIYQEKTLLVIGDAGGGKSNLLHAVGRRFGRHFAKDRYLYAKSLDPCGVLTKSGEMHGYGMFIFTDCDLVSLQNSRLSEEHVKGLFRVYEPAHYMARYGQAILPPGIPRGFAVNYGENEDGTIDYADWAKQQHHCESLIPLINKDRVALRKLANKHIALARSCVVFIFLEGETLGYNLAGIRDQQQQVHEAGLANEAAFLAGRQSS